MEVSKDEIMRAERILLKPGESFDDERRNFISEFNTVDLKAVPGSGKTTALLAKLVVLEKHLPFEDGRGVLVISHTNAAIDEIRDRLGNLCPKLFDYPNFVGTIQEFVDRFLAIPYYTSKLKCSPNLIEDNAYEEAMNKASILNMSGFTSEEKKRGLYWLNANRSLHTYRLRVQDGKTIVCKSVSGSEIVIKKPIPKSKKGSHTEDWSDEYKQRVLDWLTNLKYRVISEFGVLHYDDAYYLAQRFLNSNPKIKKLLRSRFKCVFVDEMQDMRKHQHDILEDIFFCAEVAYQRIGDSNQAIFSGGSEEEVSWSKRSEGSTLALSGSHRLTPETASIVQKFAVDDSVQISGLRSKTGTPLMIVFHHTRICDVIPRFTELVQEKVPDFRELGKPVMALGWVKAGKKAGNLGIVDYQPNWQESATLSAKSPGFTKAKEYVIAAEQAVKTGHILGLAKSHLVRALCKALKLDRIEPQEGRFWSVPRLDRLMRESSDSTEQWMKGIFEVCIDVAKGQVDLGQSNLQALYGLVLQELGKSEQKITEEFWQDSEPDDVSSNSVVEAQKASNLVTEDSGLTVDIGTVHSAKGQTHTATLLLETYMNRGYESTRLRNSFFGKGKYENPTQRTAARMAYVAMSRPTHLLAFAVSESNFNKMGTTPDGWEIIQLENAEELNNT